MAVIKVRKVKATLSKAVRYVTNDAKTMERTLVTASWNPAEKDPSRLASQMQRVVDSAVHAPRQGGLLAYHIIQSFSPSDPVDPETVHDLGIELMERIAPGRRWLVCTHTDREHIHNHILMVPVDPATGRHDRMPRDYIDRWRRASDELCRERGLSVLPDPAPVRTARPHGRSMAEIYTSARGEGIKSAMRQAADLAGSDRFNPLRYVDPEHPEKSIRELVENIIVNTTAEGSKDDAFWGAAERTLLTALVAWVWFTGWHADGWDDEKGEGSHEPSLVDAADLLELMDASEQDEDRLSPVDLLMRSAQEVYDRARATGFAGYDADARRTLEGVRFATRSYRRYSQGAGETKKSIIISLGVRLSPLAIHEVRQILSGDDIRIDELDEGRSAVFLALSDTDSTFNWLAAVFYQCLFGTMVRRADANPGQRLDHELHCFLDEFANIGKIPAFQTLIATIRSRGISASVIVQNLAQLKALYDKQWETICGNCDSTLFLGGNEETTTKWVSERLGKATIDTRSTSQSKGTNGSWTVSWQRNARELLTPDELGVLPGDECVYMLRGVPPFLSRKMR